MITKLTLEQESQLSAYYKEWLAIGRSCEPLNKNEAIEIVNELYALLGKPAPAVLVFSSPAMCVLAWGAMKIIFGKEPKKLGNQLWGQLGGQLRNQLWGQLGGQLRNQLGGQLRNQLWGQLGDQLWNQLWGQLGDQLGDQLRDQLGGQLRNQLGGQLGDQLGDQLWGQLRDQLWNQLWGQLGDQLGDQLSNYIGGQHWSYWQAFYKFCSIVGMKYAKQQESLLDLWVREGRSLHWWFPYEGVVLLSERHTVLNVDEQGMLHSAHTQSCGYSDGWGLWSWHGVNVPQYVIEQPETITVKHIQKEENAEVRRVMLERFGLDKFIQASGARLIHEEDLEGNYPEYVNLGEERRFVGYHRGTQHIRLLETDVINRDGQKLKAVHVKCPSTGREYFLGVKSHHTRAIEAVASTYQGMSETDYRTMIEAHS